MNIVLRVTAFLKKGSQIALATTDGSTAESEIALSQFRQQFFQAFGHVLAGAHSSHLVLRIKFLSVTHCCPQSSGLANMLANSAVPSCTWKPIGPLWGKSSTRAAEYRSEKPELWITLRERRERDTTVLFQPFGPVEFERTRRGRGLPDSPRRITDNSVFSEVRRQSNCSSIFPNSVCVQRGPPAASARRTQSCGCQLFFDSAEGERQPDRSRPL